jgi:hypothetical protein
MYLNLDIYEGVLGMRLRHRLLSINWADYAMYFAVASKAGEDVQQFILVLNF